MYVKSWQAIDGWFDWHESQQLACDEQEQAQAVLGGSKKGNDVRRQEILGDGSGSLAGMLCSTCSAHAADMLRDPRACDVIVEVAQGGSAGKQKCPHTSANSLLKLCAQFLYSTITCTVYPGWRALKRHLVAFAVAIAEALRLHCCRCSVCSSCNRCDASTAVHRSSSCFGPSSIGTT